MSKAAVDARLLSAVYTGTWPATDGVRLYCGYDRQVLPDGTRKNLTDFC